MATDSSGSNDDWKRKVQKVHRDAASDTSRNLHVTRNLERGGWDVMAEGDVRPSAHELTRRAAERRAKRILKLLGRDDVEIIVHIRMPRASGNCPGQESGSAHTEGD